MPGRAGLPRYYLDACVLISYVEQDPSRIADVDPLIELGAKKQAELFTSVISVVEVAYIARERHQGLDPAVETAIDQLWFPNSPIRIVEMHPFIARRARELHRIALDKRWKRLSLPDAIHLATAEDAEVEALYTYNVDDYKAFAPIVPFRITEPPGGQTSILGGTHVVPQSG
jgi:predicted nucleic acid-binding protein